MKENSSYVLRPEQLDQLIDAMAEAGFEVWGPRLAGGAVVYDRISRASQLPQGWRDRQDGGSYALEPREDQALFGYNLGQDSWKRIFYPPQISLLEAERGPGGWRLRTGQNEEPPLALLGVRPCELAAIQAQDAVLMRGPYADPLYRQRRQEALIVAVNCTQAGGTCFCASLGTGPGADSGFDLAITELVDETSHVLVLEQGSQRGGQIIAGLDLPPAGELAEQARQAVAETAQTMDRALDAKGLGQRLMAGIDGSAWEELAARCLNCGNCTMVCPTCFCCTVQDAQELSGERASRLRRWDSCFTVDHSYIHGGSIRTSPMARYRQWLTHKLATWPEQFDTPGCVGCGRCITWCPVGIDITEMAVMAAGQAPGPLQGEMK